MGVDVVGRVRRTRDRVEPPTTSRWLAGNLCRNEVQAGEIVALGEISPALYEFPGVGQQLGAKDVEKGLAIYSEVAFVSERWEDRPEVGIEVFGTRIGLLHEDPRRLSFP